MAGGRPTEYTQDVIDKARHYAENFEEYGDVVPTIAGMACEIGRSRDTLYEWSTHPDKQEFSDICKKVMEFQERKLVNGGLGGGFNPAVTKMMLTKHGYSDKQEVDHTTKGESFNKIQRTVVDAPDAGD